MSEVDFNNNNIKYSYTLDNNSKINISTVALKSFFLGLFLLANFTCYLLSLTGNLSNNYHEIFVYFTFISLFHYLEFMFVSLYNKNNVDNDSFILEDSNVYKIYFLSLLEHVTMKLFFSKFSLKNSHTLCLGIIFSLSGQFVRSLAIKTAGRSFNHIINEKYIKQNKLVTNGIYSVCRHPSYLGYLIWFIGLEIILNNFITLLVGYVILTIFFNKRIEMEEEILSRTFKDEYKVYKKKVNSYIGFFPKNLNIYLKCLNIF